MVSGQWRNYIRLVLTHGFLHLHGADLCKSCEVDANSFTVRAPKLRFKTGFRPPRRLWIGASANEPTSSDSARFMLMVFSPPTSCEQIILAGSRRACSENHVPASVCFGLSETVGSFEFLSHQFPGGLLFGERPSPCYASDLPASITPWFRSHDTNT